MRQYAQQYEQEDDSGPGLGTLAGILAAGAMATPVGRPVRKLLKNTDKLVGSPVGKSTGKLKEWASSPLGKAGDYFGGGVMDRARLAAKDAVARTDNEFLALKNAGLLSGEVPIDTGSLRATGSNIKATGRGTKAALDSLWKDMREGWKVRGAPVVAPAVEQAAAQAAPTTAQEIVEQAAPIQAVARELPSTPAGQLNLFGRYDVQMPASPAVHLQARPEVNTRQLALDLPEPLPLKEKIKAIAAQPVPEAVVKAGEAGRAAPTPKPRRARPPVQKIKAAKEYLAGDISPESEKDFLKALERISNPAKKESLRNAWSAKKAGIAAKTNPFK